MNNLVVNKLYIFSTSEKKAKTIEFSVGTNVVTSDKYDGNKKGKSTILQSIYYTLGAEAFFDDEWKPRLKTYVIDITVLGERYFIYRQKDLFKVFDFEKRIVFLSHERRQLAEFLADIYKFSIKLPQRGNKELKLASPVYSYLLNFIGQDRMKGPQFQSFENLGEFENFKENLIYSHFGVFDDNYYKFTLELENLSRELVVKNEHNKITKAMIDKVDNELDGGDFSSSLPILEVDISRYQKEYGEYTNNLDQIKKNLIKLRNNYGVVTEQLSELRKIFDKNNKEAQELRQSNKICPECLSEVEITFEMRIEKFGTIDDIYLLISNNQERLNEINETIRKKENEYREVLFSLKNYEEKIKINSKHTQEILKHKGLVTLKDDLLQELGKIEWDINILEKMMKEIRDNLKIYKDKKDRINCAYYDLMLEGKDIFELKEIEDKKLKLIGSVFKATGSSLPLATVVWYVSLIKLKNQFNPNAIKFPLILDSPTNFEKDETRAKALMKFIFDSCPKDTQLILSTLGFEANDFPEIAIDNIIFLDNKRYALLNSKDFEENQEFLNELILAEAPDRDSL